MKKIKKKKKPENDKNYLIIKTIILCLSDALKI